MTRPPTPPATIPDDVVVWAAADIHGQLRATRAALREAGLVDADGRWSAPPRTAFIVCGDIVDRGPDSLGLLRWLLGLREEAAQRDGFVVLLEGNHEIQALLAIEGDPVVADAWMLFGAAALLESAGMTEDEFGPDRPPTAVARRLAALAPDLEPALRSLPPYARWRDVLLVHGGPTPDVPSLEAYAASVERLWIRHDFFEAADPFPDGPSWRVYREAGLRRVVFGHTRVAAPTTYHAGHALDIDTWTGRRVTLARIPADGSLDAAEFVTVEADDRRPGDRHVAPDEVREWDALLPRRIDAIRAGAPVTASR